MIWRPYRSHRVRLAVAGLVASLAGLATTTWRAVTLEPLPNPDVATTVGAAVLAVADSELPSDGVLGAIDVDPFHPDRRRPGIRFRLPSERRTTVRAVAPPALPRGTQLTGTLVYPDGGGAAMLLQPGRQTQMVRIGEAVGTLRLQEVNRERAVFVSPNGARVVLRVTRPGGSS